MAASLMAGMAFLAAIYALMGALLNNIIAGYNLSDSAQGLASSAASAGCIIALVTSFLLIGRLPKIRLLQISVIICFAFLALLKISPNFSMFVFLWLILGIGMGYLDSLCSSCMADLYRGTGHTATFMMCMLHMTFGISNTVTPIIFSGMLKGGIQWKSIYLYVAAAGLLLFLFLSYSIRINAGNSERSVIATEQKLSFKRMAQLLSRPPIPGLFTAMFFHGFFLGGLNTWINRYVGVTLGSSLGDIALSFMFFGVLFSRLIVPFTPIKPQKYVCTAGFAAGILLLVAVPFRNGTIMCIAVALSGLAYGAIIPCIHNLACAAMPESSMLVTSANMIMVFIAQVIASPLIGALESAFNLHVGIVILGICMMLCSVCALFGGVGRIKG